MIHYGSVSSKITARATLCCVSFTNNCSKLVETYLEQQEVAADNLSTYWNLILTTKPRLVSLRSRILRRWTVAQENGEGTAPNCWGELCEGNGIGCLTCKLPDSLGRRVGVRTPDLCRVKAALYR